MVISPQARNALVLSLLTIMIATLILPVSAAHKTMFKASGKVLQVNVNIFPPPVWQPVIVSGEWQLSVYSTGYDAVISYQMSYTQTRLDGTLEEVTTKIDSVMYVTLNSDGCVITGPDPHIRVDSEGITLTYDAASGYNVITGSTVMMKFMPS